MVGFAPAAAPSSQAEGRRRPSWEGLHVRLAAALYVNMDISLLALPFVIGAFQPPGAHSGRAFWLSAALTRETCFALLLLFLKWFLMPLVFKRRESVQRARGMLVQGDSRKSCLATLLC